MRISLLMMGLALSVLSYAANATEHEIPSHYSHPGFDFNGAVGASAYSYQGNRSTFNNAELVGGVGYDVSENVRLYATGSLTEHAATVRAASVSYLRDTSVGEFNLLVGRLAHRTGSSGYKRLNPATRGIIILPQAMHWSKIEDTMGAGDGLKVTMTARGGSYLQMYREKMSVQDSAFITEVLAIPGQIQGGWSNSYEAVYVHDNLYVGAEHRTWNFESSIVGSQPLKTQALFVNWESVRHAAFASYSSVANTFTMTTMGQAKGQILDFTYSYDCSDRVRTTFNHNVIDFNSSILARIDPDRNKTTDNNISVQYRELGKHFIYRAEYHLVNGTGWYSRRDNPTGLTRHSKILAAQVIYEF